MGRGAFVNLTAEEYMDRVWVSSALGYRPSNILYVNSGSSPNGANAQGLLASDPFATIAQALTKVTDAMSDTIVVMAGHAETLSATTQGLLLSGSYDGLN